MSKAINLTMLDSGVARITIDLPDSKVNLLSASVMGELNDALDQIGQNGSCKGVMLVSGKDDFGAGANVEEIQALQKQPGIKIYEATKQGKALFARLEKLNSIAVIRGLSLGGFTELALACRFRIAVNDDKTQIGVPEVQLGFIPGWGGTVRLPRLIGLTATLMPEKLPNGMKLPFGWGGLTAGSNADARKAWRIGLVDELVDSGEANARAEAILLGAQPKRFRFGLKDRVLRSMLDGTSLGRTLVSKMAYGGVMAVTKGKYPAPVQALKVAVLSAKGGDRDQAFEAESQAFAQLATSRVSRNLVGIFFAQTESKKMPDGVKPEIDVKVVGVLGAGVMGAGIAQLLAYKGYQVILKDADARDPQGNVIPGSGEKFLARGMDTIRSLFAELVSRKKLSQSEADEMVASIKPTLDYADLSECDMVIEAVVEKLPVKKIVRAELEKVIKKPFIFATNTSSLSVSEMTHELSDGNGCIIAEAARHPENVVGVHYFNPVHKMPLVEIVRGATTSSATLAAAKSLALKQGKTTVTCADKPGFAVNRDLAPYMREAIVMAEEGVPIEDIEKAALDFGMKMGPFSLLDEVGLDIAGHVIHTLHGALGDRLSPPPILKTIEDLKLLGRKGKKGIYLYDEKGERRFVIEKTKGKGLLGKLMPAKKRKKYILNPDVTNAIKARVNKKTAGEIQDRLFLAMVAEGARCIEEKVVDNASQFDLAMIFGTGFPPFVGGPLRWADSMGIALVYQKLTYLAKVAGANYAPCALLKQMAETGGTFYND